MQNFQLLDEIETTQKTMTGVIDYVSTKYITFYDFSMNDDPYIIKVILLWRSYFTHMRFSVFKELYFRSVNIGYPVMINKKTVVSGVPNITTKPKRKTERVLPKNAVIVNFVKNTNDHQSV